MLLLPFLACTHSKEGASPDAGSTDSRHEAPADSGETDPGETDPGETDPGETDSEPTDSDAAPQRPTWSEAVPYTPDGGSWIDPRFGGCTLRQTNTDLADASLGWSYDLVFDDAGRGIAEDNTVTDASGTETWSYRIERDTRGCITAYTETSDGPSGPSTSAYTASCDDAGNPLDVRYRTDGELTEHKIYTYTYDDDGWLVAATMTDPLNDSTYEVRFSYSGNYLALSDVIMEYSGWAYTQQLAYTSDAVGRLVAKTITLCAGFGVESCVTTRDERFDYDGDGHLVSGAGSTTEASWSTDGTASETLSTWTATWEPAELPEVGEYQFPLEGRAQSAIYQYDCD